VGGGVALSPCIPDAQQTRFPGEFPKPPAVRKTGLVDGAVSLEEPEKAHKPGQRRQVSTRVSQVSIPEHGPERTQQEDDPHGLLLHGPQLPSKQNDAHGLQTNESETAHTQGTPPGTLTAKGTQPTYAHADNPSRATLDETGAHVGHPGRQRRKTHNGAHCGSLTNGPQRSAGPHLHLEDRYAHH
jgi:hypothetical protein